MKKDVPLLWLVQLCMFSEQFNKRVKLHSLQYIRPAKNSIKSPFHFLLFTENTTKFELFKLQTYQCIISEQNRSEHNVPRGSIIYLLGSAMLPFLQKREDIAKLQDLDHSLQEKDILCYFF